MENYNEVSPPGWSGTVAAMLQKHPEIDNPWALAWWQKKHHEKPHYKEQPDKDSQDPHKPKKKKKYKDEEKKSFKEWFYEQLSKETVHQEGFFGNMMNQARLMTGMGRNQIGGQPQTGDNVTVWLNCKPNGWGGITVGDAHQGILNIGQNGEAIMKSGTGSMNIGNIQQLMQNGKMVKSQNGRGWAIYL